MGIYSQIGIDNSQIVDILIVEDNDVWINLVQRYFQNSNHVIHISKSLKEAREFLENNNFIKAILLDLGLPDGNGIQTFVRMFEYAKDIPIIIVTGEIEGDLWLEAMQSGAAGWLQKNKIDKRGYAIEVMVKYARIFKLLEQILTNERNQAQEERDRWSKLIEEIWLINSVLLGNAKDVGSNPDLFDKTMTVLRAAKNAGSHMMDREIDEQGFNVLSR